MKRGFSLAAQFLKSQQAGSASELKDKRIAELEKEVKELRASTAISGGGVTSKPSPVDFDQMSLEQQERYLAADVQKLDQAHTY